MTESAKQLTDVEYRNSFVDSLKGEESGSLYPRQTPGYCYSLVAPTPVSKPHLLAWTESLGRFLNLAQPPATGRVVDILAGNGTAEGMKPFAARYGGHQFGNWAGQLGDGRAISLCEIKALDGTFWELQLKGAGPTPYSRNADGRAVLRSSLREFLCSEAMYNLGVPTTRALSLVATGDEVLRDMFYTGDVRSEKGAVVTRVAATFVRFGNFEIFKERREIENLKALADYIISHHFPELGTPNASVYGEWFREVARRTAKMVAHWMAVGFVHGVMNTDNMSILGLTIDYGPYGWLEPYDPEWTPNTTDFREHRYAFGQQPSVALWNLSMLANALEPLVADKSILETGLDGYPAAFAQSYFSLMATKLGFTGLRGGEDEDLITELHEPLTVSQIDMTIFLRQLSQAAPKLVASSEEPQAQFDHILQQSTYHSGTFDHARMKRWLLAYWSRLKSEQSSSQEISQRMLRANPKFVLRNYLAQQAIDQVEQGDVTLLTTLMKVLESPFDEFPEYEHLAAKRPEWAKDKPGCATLSCSS